MKYHSEEQQDESVTHPADCHDVLPSSNEKTKLLSPPSSAEKKTSYNVRSMLVHSPYIVPVTRKDGTATNKVKPNRIRGGGSSSSSANITTMKRAILTKKQLSKIKARKKLGSYRRNRRGGDYYDTWKGRVSVHIEVQEFDLKLLEKNVIAKSDLVSDKGWEYIAFYDVIRLWLPVVVPAPPVAINTLLPNDKHNISSVSNVLPEQVIDEGAILETFLDQTSSSMLNNNSRVDDGKSGTMMENRPELRNNQEGASHPEVYIFAFGEIVFWNFENDEHEKSWMQQYLFMNTTQEQNQSDGDCEYQAEGDEEGYDTIGDRYDPEAIESANDEIAFVYGEKFQMKRDVVQLQTTEYGEKLAVSFALAKSANLSIFEWRLDQVIERNSHIPEELAKYGRIHMSRKEISMEIGRIFLVKSGINLENNMLDTPEEFWEDDKFHNEYKKAMEYFDINSRLDLVNTRLAVLHDMNQILIEATQSHHASMLEWTVIILIVFEILVEIYRTYRDYQDE